MPITPKAEKVSTQALRAMRPGSTKVFFLPTPKDLSTARSICSRLNTEGVPKGIKRYAIRCDRVNQVAIVHAEPGQWLSQAEQAQRQAQ